MEGDQHKMREALKTCRNIAAWIRSGSASVEAGVERIQTEIDKALAAPPRNCDVGTPDERMHRYNELCREISDRHERIGAHAPSFAFPTEFEWEDRPYEEGGAK